MYNITDVAKRAGVSVATVSRVLNSSPSVSDKTREKVLGVIDEMGYNPNGIARNLRMQQTKIIIVILPSITNSFFAKVVRGIEDMGHIKGYNVLLCTTGNIKERELLYLDMLKSRQADGVIFMTSTLAKEELEEFGRLYPCVQCNEYIECDNIPYVSIDNIKAAQEVTEHLIALGHKSIAMISEPTTVSAAMREKGYKNVIERHNIKSSIIEYGNYSFNSGYKAAKKILEKDKSVTAIFSVSDIMALGAMRACMDMGLKIPEEMAVAGFDNVKMSTMFRPELTTISQPQNQLGETAAGMLIEKIENSGKTPENIFMPHRLIIRESTKQEELT